MDVPFAAGRADRGRGGVARVTEVKRASELRPSSHRWRVGNHAAAGRRQLLARSAARRTYLPTAAGEVRVS